MKDYTFGNFICELREGKCLTQREVADMLGVTPAAISKWENGSSKPRVDLLFKLAEILGVRAEELIAGRRLSEESISPEAIKQINERYEYLCRIESYYSTGVKLKRLLSSIIDLSFASAITYFFTCVLNGVLTRAEFTEGITSILCVLHLLISFVLLFGLRDILFFGKSAGKRIMGLTVLDKRTGMKAGVRQRLLRNAATVMLTLISPLLLAVDCIIMLVRGQSVGDSLAHTVVVEKNQVNYEHFPNPDHCMVYVDYKEINAYTPPPFGDKRFLIGVTFVITFIIIISVIFTAIYFINFDSIETVSTDISKYREDIDSIGNAAEFMPDIEALADYIYISYSKKTKVDSRFMGFIGNGLALFVQYDESVYESKKAEVLNSYTFPEASLFDNQGDIPLTEFIYEGYRMNVIFDGNYGCKSFAIVGFDDENRGIVYCYYYNIDLDYIAKQGDDLNEKMHEFMSISFEWKSSDYPPTFLPLPKKSKSY